MAKRGRRSTARVGLAVALALAASLRDTRAAFGDGAQSPPLRPARTVDFDTDEGTWLSPDVSPDGRTIVFELLGDLYAMDAAGGEARAITRGLAFDSQPVFSPDGARIVFLSDRSGAENVWTAAPDGSAPRQVSFRDDNSVFASPAWSADGRSIFVSHHRSDLDASFELWRFDLDGEPAGTLLIPVKASPEQPREAWTSVLGAAPSPDGRFLYYAAHVGGRSREAVPEWVIRRRDLHSGGEETIVSAPRSPRRDLVLGTAFRPAVSPDGRRLVYGARSRGRTGLRLVDLATGDDRWLAFPVQQDELMGASWRDLLPRHDFTPDGAALIMNDGGRIRRLDVATGEATDIPFRAHVALELGPALRVSVEQERGPVRARLIQAPEPSPDGTRIAFSALGHVYVMALDGRSAPRRLTADAHTQFQPSWSPDGHMVVYVTWTAREAGHIWSAPADGHGPAQRLTDTAAYYTSPVFTPDGRQVVALRSSNVARMHSYMEYGTTRQAELVVLPAGGGGATVVHRGQLGGKPHFAAKPGDVHVLSGDGLDAVELDGSGHRRVLKVTGPGWYFAEGRAHADDLRISPDGRWVLAQIAQQLHLLGMPAEGATVDLAEPPVPHRKITDVGADFFAWADAGRTITWAVGSTFYRRPLASVAFDAPGAPRRSADAPPPGTAGVTSHAAVVEMPRDTPRGTLVLRGGSAITMRGDEVVPDADVVIVDDRIAAVGARGTVMVPPGAIVRDVRGRFLVPGFIDAHDHLADIRRGVLDLESWGPLANLAYGVTTAFDPSTLSIDTLAYEDLMDAGLMLGSRIHSTGPAVFSFNEFRSKDEVRKVLSRHRDHYRTRNLKQYRVGNRRVRQWFAEAAHELGLMPTTEGALSMKLNLTHVMDGFAGFEHALTAVPLYGDVVRLVAKSGTSYTATLLEPNGQDYFIVRDHPRDDPRLNRFAPQFVVEMKTSTRTWRELDEYLFPRVADGVARVARTGGLVGMGSHGEVPGLGLHWEMQAHAMGGMTPAEVLRAATIGAAATIGRDAEFGTLAPGKYADLVVLDRDPRVDIANTLTIREVMKNGRLYDADTMDEVWPRRKTLQRPWYWDDRPPGTPDPGAAPDRKATVPRKLVEIYRVAPGQHEAFLEAIARYDEANRMAGLPPRELYVHSDGAGWDFLIIQPAQTPPEKSAALDAAWEKLGLPSGPDFFLEFRRYVAEHDDTFAQGPTTAADFLARRKKR